MYYANSDHATKEIGEGANLAFETLLACRSKLEFTKIHDTVQELYRFVEGAGVNAVGPIIVTLHSGSVRDDSILLDLEFLLPLPDKIILKSPYTLIPSFTISKAIYKRHAGPIATLGRTYESLYAYCDRQGLQAVTDIHHIAVSPPTVNPESDEFCIDVYIGTRSVS